MLDLAWVADNKLPLGEHIAIFVELLTANAAGFFDLISVGLGVVITSLTNVLLWVPPLVLIALIAGLSYFLQRSVKLVAFVVLALLLVVNLGYWQASMETLSLVICATWVCLVVGIPIGIAAAHRPWLEASLRPLLDLMQTIPTFVYLIPTLILFGLGVVPGLISTVIFALPAPIRLTTLGNASVPKTLIAAGESSC